MNPDTTKQIRISMNETKQQKPDYCDELEPLPETVLPLPDVVPLPELEPLPKVKSIRLKGESGTKRQRKSKATKPSDKTAKQAKQTKGGKANL